MWDDELPNLGHMAISEGIASDDEAVVSDGEDTTSTSTEASKPSFTCFPNLPVEIQDNLGEALTGVAVLGLRDSDDWNPTHVQIIRVGGFNPLPVALACQAAASRWRHLYPFCMIYASPVRLDLDLTVLYAATAEEILHFMIDLKRIEKQSLRKDGFHARHFAYRDDWRDSMDWVDLMISSSYYMPQNLSPINPKCGGLLARRRQTETVIAVKPWIGCSQKDIVYEVVRMIQEPDYRRECTRNHEGCDTCKEAGIGCWRLDWRLEDCSMATGFWPGLLTYFPGVGDLDLDTSRHGNGILDNGHFGDGKPVYHD